MWMLRNPLAQASAGSNPAPRTNCNSTASRVFNVVWTLKKNGYRRGRKEKLKEILMAKRIIDAMTETLLPKTLTNTEMLPEKKES